jgi:hypothetical protein
MLSTLVELAVTWDHQGRLVSRGGTFIFVGQAFEPDDLALRGSGVKLESLAYGAFQHPPNEVVL